MNFVFFVDFVAQIVVNVVARIIVNVVAEIP